MNTKEILELIAHFEQALDMEKTVFHDLPGFANGWVEGRSENEKRLLNRYWEIKKAIPVDMMKMMDEEEANQE